MSPPRPIKAMSITDARRNLRQILEELKSGATRAYRIQRRGQTLAMIATLTDAAPLLTAPRRAMASSEAMARLSEHLTHAHTTGQATVITQYDRDEAAIIPADHPLSLQGEPMTHQTRILTFFSHAGGVGKTTSCRDLGYELAQLGYRVLLIDLDAQANLTTWLGVDPNAESSVTIYDSVVHDAPLPEPVHVHGMDLIPADLQLARLDPDLSAMPMGGTPRLKKALHPLVAEGRYDFILLDTPPSLGKVIGIALFAAHHVVIPVSSEPKGVEAVATVHQMIEDMAEYNPDLTILTHLFTQRDTTALSRAVAEQGKVAFSNPSGPISRLNAPYGRCVDARLPLGAYEPAGRARTEVQNAAQQVLGYLGLNVPQAAGHAR
jgi:chromosome partitioning protein